MDELRGVGGGKVSEYIPVPAMADIEAAPSCGLRIVSTFSGCGGSCLGFRMAGYRTLWASEFVPIAAETYRRNHPGVHVDARDIREVKPEEILEQAGLRVGELDIFEGSPPCASFSTAGNRESDWGKVKKYSETSQRTDDLFFEYVRLLEGLQPKVFVAENVKGLVIGKAKGYFKQIYGAMQQAGYRVSCRVLDAQYFGVPQHRERAIFVGVRNDLERAPSHPKPQTAPVPLRAALPWITEIATNSSFEVRWKEADRPAPMILQSGGNENGGMCLADTSIARYAIGDEWDKLSVGEQSEKYFQLVKADPNKPCPTVLQSSGLSVACAVHPYEKRKFTIAELKRICGFPDDFDLPGTYAQQWERLGRAVPPPMMRAIAEHIRDEILAV
jgi:DNA (cytosine-5)-methyltransferase 1